MIQLCSSAHTHRHGYLVGIILGDGGEGARVRMLICFDDALH